MDFRVLWCMKRDALKQLNTPLISTIRNPDYLRNRGTGKENVQRYPHCIRIDSMALCTWFEGEANLTMERVH